MTFHDFFSRVSPFDSQSGLHPERLVSSVHTFEGQSTVRSRMIRGSRPFRESM